MMNKLRKLIDLLKFLHLQRVKGFAPPGDEPFMDAAGIDRFRREVSRARSYVEFGSGGSTVFVDSARIPAISVENDPYYARVVASKLNNVSVEQRVIRMGLTQAWGVPLFPNAQRAKAYVQAPWSSTTFPDLVLVDGRYRVACALESARRAHEAGAEATLMFDDYVSRDHYHVVERYLGTPELAGRAAMFRIGSYKVSEADVEPWLNDWR
ncbi:MAG: hypothetical protein ACK44O_06315 [Novosphingobium sp.]|jgi:hypothetical protein